MLNELSLGKHISPLNSEISLFVHLIPKLSPASLTHYTSHLQAHQLFVEHYWTFTRGSLAKLIPFPQRLYVPGRMRRMYQPRLEAIGMWDAHYIEEPEPPKPTTKTPEQPGIPPAQVYKHAFAQERVRLTSWFSLPKLILHNSAIGQSTNGV